MLPASFEQQEKECQQPQEIVSAQRSNQQLMRIIHWRSCETGEEQDG